MADTDGADRDTATDTGAAMLVTADVAAAMAGVSARTIRRWIQRGYLPATHSPDGYLVSPADLAAARAAAGHGRGHGHGHGHRAAVTDADADTDANWRHAPSAPPVAVSPSASAQLAAIRDEWLQPLVDRIAELERDRGRLEAEREEQRRRAEAAERTIEELLRRGDVAAQELEGQRDRADTLQARHDAPRSTAVFRGPQASPAATGAPEAEEMTTTAGGALGRLQRLWRALRGGDPSV